ncbi:MAG: iron-containing alcohol dehydrogenase [Deltaproteobacteria bacterium]|jgi:alcohol dehydrogenase class IV|nr:iron-containing alcohol dehydrogenase [Deltaproteobacteria bacterium]
MGYWFENPTLKALAPLALSTSIKGLTTIFNTPKLFIGSNVFPEGPVVGPSTMDSLLPRCPNKRAFIVTDEFSKRFANKAARFLESGGFKVELWAGCQPEAPMEVVVECAKAVKDFEPDLIMAVGGGSVIDSAKAAWILYERPDITDLGMISPLDKLKLRGKAVLAAVPTTSGTGSECTGAAVLHDTAAHRKIPIAHDELVPDFAVLVPEFTVTMPPKLTAGTGLDVLAHAMDAVTTPAGNEFTEPLALKAIEMVFQWLPRAYKNGQDREARHRMIMAASIAGVAFGMSGCHLTHSFGHSLGAVFNLHHGLAVGFFIPHSLQFCSKVTDKHLLTCKALSIEAKDAKDGLVKLVSRVRSFLTELGVSLTLKDMGIPWGEFKAKLDQLVEFAYGDVDCYLSPRPITKAQCAQILQYAYDGRDIDF